MVQKITETELQRKVFSLIAQGAGIEAKDIKPLDSLYSDLGFDSLDRVDAVQGLERIFIEHTGDDTIIFPDIETQRWNTVGDVLDYARQYARREGLYRS